MESLLSMVAFLALVVSWFVLPAGSKPATLPDTALPDAMPSAA